MEFAVRAINAFAASGGNGGQGTALPVEVVGLVRAAMVAANDVALGRHVDVARQIVFKLRRVLELHEDALKSKVGGP